MPDTATAKNKNRRIRQQALREQLQAQGHEQHIVEMVDKIRDESTKIEPSMLRRYEVAINTKLKLLNKYIPDLKQTDVELTGEDGSPIETTNSINFLPVGSK